MLRETIKSNWCLFARWWCRMFCRVFFRMRFEGLENVPAKGPFILAANHQSFLDPLFAGIVLKGQLNFMARDTLFKSRIFGPLLSSVKAIPVRRGQADIASIKMIIAKLKQGESVCLFPEATRTTDGKIASFKGGLSLLSRRANAPVVPVLIEGAFECWPRHQKLFTAGSKITVSYGRPRHQKLFTAGSKITVSYGRPISAEQIKNMDDDDFARLLTERLRSMQSQIRINQGKQPYSYS